MPSTITRGMAGDYSTLTGARQEGSTHVTNADMKRVIVEIDEARCDGCGECVPSCAEGAIRMVNGKARLVGDQLCDGLGACLGECPQGAIRVVEREAIPFDEAAVARHLAGPSPAHPMIPPLPAASRRSLPVVRMDAGPDAGPDAGGCPGSRSAERVPPRPVPAGDGAPSPSQLSHWPVQIPLVSPRAPWLAGADVLLAADCVPFAYADFHRDLLAGRRVLVGCPKLDELQVIVERLAGVFREARPRSVTVAKMEVPCCGGIAWAAREALRLAGLPLAITEVTIGVSGARLS